MRGDFTRDTFDPTKHFSRVLMQQGRVQVDADWNEQASILLHYMRTVVADLVGPYAAPDKGGGFELVDSDKSNGYFRVTQGRIYVDGILVENDSPDTDTTFVNQPYLRPEPLKDDGDYIVYLDVWEDHVTALEDPHIRETALGGPDTATRARVVWQVKTMRAVTFREPLLPELTKDINVHTSRLNEFKEEYKQSQSPKSREILNRRILVEKEQLEYIQMRLDAKSKQQPDWCGLIGKRPHLSDAWLKAQVEPTEASKNPCIQSPDAKYRGAGNQLYRVEIHRGGKANLSTFKWSRDNGSVVTRLIDVQANQLVVQCARGFSPNTWVELSNDDLRMNGEPGPLVKLVTVEADTLAFDSSPKTGTSDLTQMTCVRRWDQREVGDAELVDGAIPVREREWISLEDGIQVWFEGGGEYRSGDYWLIPARVIGGGIEWETETGKNGEEQPIAVQPRGIVHHYAPLGVVTVNGAQVHVNEDCRCTFSPIRKCSG